jgi:hypothetical protein
MRRARDATDHNVLNARVGQNPHHPKQAHCLALSA